MDYVSRNLVKELVDAARQPGDRGDVIEPLVAKFSQAGVSLDSPDLLLGRSALHYASAKGHVKVMMALLSAKADISVGDKRGQTALHHAVLFDCVQLPPPCSDLESPIPTGIWLDNVGLGTLKVIGVLDPYSTQNEVQAAYDAGSLQARLQSNSKVSPFVKLKLEAILDRRKKSILSYYEKTASEEDVARIRDHRTPTPTHWWFKPHDPASLRGPVQLLLRGGANPSVVDKSGESAIGICDRLGRSLLATKLREIASRIEERGLIVREKLWVRANPGNYVPSAVDQKLLERQRRTQNALESALSDGQSNVESSDLLEAVESSSIHGGADAQQNTSAAERLRLRVAERQAHSNATQSASRKTQTLDEKRAVWRVCDYEDYWLDAFVYCCGVELSNMLLLQQARRNEWKAKNNTSHSAPTEASAGTAPSNNGFIEQGGAFLLRMQQQAQIQKQAKIQAQSASGIQGRDTLAAMMAAQLKKMVDR